MFSYSGRQILVIGGGRGIGRAIALAHARAGANIAVAARNVEQLNDVVNEIKALGREAWALPVDLSERGAAEGLITRALDALGRIDVLVNSAGDIGLQGRASFDLDEDDFDQVFRLHARASLLTSTKAAQSMVERGIRGAILNIASVGGLFPAPSAVLYGSAKAAVLHLTKSLAMEYGMHGIRVNAIAPGLVETPLIEHLIASEEARADSASFYPLNRLGNVDDVAAASIYLCSDEAAWVSGETLMINGGQHASSAMFRWPRTHNHVPPSRRI